MFEEEEEEEEGFELGRRAFRRPRAAQTGFVALKGEKVWAEGPPRRETAASTRGSFSAGCQGAVLRRECPSHSVVALGAVTTPLPSLRDTAKSLLQRS